jgi:opacity protein-like surface antigen
MKQICAALIAVLAITLSLAGQASAPKTTAETAGPAMPPGFFNTTVGFTIGTYKSPDSRFNEVYGANTSSQFGLNLSRTLLDYRGFQVDLSLEARTLSKTGQATLSGEEAKISLMPLTAAGRLLYRTKYIIPFIGAGGDRYHYKEESAIANTSGWANGYHFQGGVYIVVPGADSLRVELYYKYTKVTATANEISVQLGGPEYGIGLSFGFNILNKAAVMVR